MFNEVMKKEKLTLKPKKIEKLMNHRGYKFRFKKNDRENDLSFFVFSKDDLYKPRTKVSLVINSGDTYIIYTYNTKPMFDKELIERFNKKKKYILQYLNI